MQNQPTPGEWTAMISGLVMLIFSFFAWTSFGFGANNFNAWSEFFPLVTWAPICGTIVGVLVALKVFGSIQYPTNIGGFSIKQIYFVLAIFSILVTIGVLISFATRGIGFWLNFIGSIGLVIGTGMMLYTEDEQTGAPGTGRSTPF